MKKYLLLLPSLTARYDEWSPEDMQRIVADYAAWAGRLGAAGKLLDGHKLTHDGGKVLRREGAAVRVVDGPFAEAKEVLGGIFLIQAADEAEALEIARTCPHLTYHETLELREIELGTSDDAGESAGAGHEARS